MKSGGTRRLCSPLAILLTALAMTLALATAPISAVSNRLRRSAQARLVSVGCLHRLEQFFSFNQTKRTWGVYICERRLHTGLDIIYEVRNFGVLVNILDFKIMGGGSQS